VELALDLFAGDTRATIAALLDELQYVRGHPRRSEAERFGSVIVRLELSEVRAISATTGERLI
jgi:hypothetical protein